MALNAARAPAGARPADATETTPTPRMLARVAFSSCLGSMVEWYDFFIYATAASLVFGELFFPKFDPLIGTLVALATYGAGFVVRPIGGLVFGVMGDRMGRKQALVTTLLMVGIATFVIGLLPSYATIGMAAPVILLVIRLLHGFGIGGEQGNAILITTEYAPSRQRGYYGAWVQIGAPAGFILPLGLFALLTGTLSPGAFMSWGWRIPFLASLLLVAIGLYIRLNLSESPLFRKLEASGGMQRNPLAVVLRQFPRSILLGCGAKLAESTVFTVYAVIITGYAVAHGVPRTTMTLATLLAIVIELAALPLFGALSDRIGRRPVYAFGAAISLVAAWPAFYAVYAGNTGLLWIMMIVTLGIGHPAMYGPQASFFAELFPTRMRASGAGFCLQIGALVGSVGTLGAGWLLTLGGGAPWLLCIYIAVMCAISFACVLALHETAPARAPDAERAWLG